MNHVEADLKCVRTGDRHQEHDDTQPAKTAGTPIRADEALQEQVSLSKIETHLLASLGSKGKTRNSLACLRNAGFHFAESYCTRAKRGLSALIHS